MRHVIYLKGREILVPCDHDVADIIHVWDRTDTTSVGSKHRASLESAVPICDQAIVTSKLAQIAAVGPENLVTLKTSHVPAVMRPQAVSIPVSKELPAPLP